MSEQDTTNTDNADRDLLDDLKRGQRGSSRAHDDAVLAKAAAAADDIARRDAARPEPTAAPRRFPWLLAAAAVAAVVLVPMLIVDVDDGLRNPGVAVEPAQAATLTSPPARFSWPTVPGANRYTLVLRDAGAGEVWRSAPVGDPEFSPDASLRGILTAGGSFIWTVEAATPGATTELGPFQFTVTE